VNQVSFGESRGPVSHGAPRYGGPPGRGQLI
jgi:hypothetical protein